MTPTSDIRSVLVTGATGFVGDGVMRLGRNLAGFRFIGMSRHAAAGQNPDRLIRGDVTEAASLRSATASESFDTIVHAAGLAHRFGATSAAEFQRVNVDGTRNICEVAVNAGVTRLVLISSVAVYGNNEAGLIDETADCRPSGPYAESKLAAEHAAAAICGKNGIELIILRLATVIGAGDRGNAARLVEVINGRRFIWIGNGSNRKTLIDRDDVAAAIVLAATSGFESAGGVYNLCAPPIAMREVVETISEACGKSVWPFRVPAGFSLSAVRLCGWIVGTEKAGRYEATVRKWLAEDVFDGARFSSAYNWRPTVSVVDSLRKQVASFLAEMIESTETIQKL